MKTRSLLITGITGQDGSLMAHKALREGYSVTGLFRRVSGDNLWRLRELDVLNKLELIECSIEGFDDISSILDKSSYDFIVHFAGSSFTADSFSHPLRTFSTNTSAVFYLLEAVRKKAPESLVLIASSAEVSGADRKSDGVLKLSATSRFRPTNPYGISHLSNLFIVDYYRELYKLRISVPIMFNHESELRGPQFLSRKVSNAMVNFLRDEDFVLSLGDLSAVKDWGSAREYIDYIFQALELGVMSNYVLGTGKLTSVRDILRCAFSEIEISIDFVGEGQKEVVVNSKTGKSLVIVSERYIRPVEMVPSVADTDALYEVFGAKMQSTVCDVIPEMIAAERRRLGW
jgi:GDPmannose 4,6-dehydratase